MKNIHTLPTDKPSRLYYWEDKLVLGNLATTPMNRNIYITNDEEIKVGDWLFANQGANKIIEIKDGDYPYGSINKNGDKIFNSKHWKSKIILTTDKDLIKDGVQSIPDEFLEWFVKNPSCEEVEVVKTAPIRPFGSLYKIIIPKKNFYCGDKFDYDEQCLEQCDTCVDKKGVDYGYLPKEEPKKVLTEKDIFNQKDIDAVTDYINKEQQKQALIDMMKADEELGLYDDIEINRIKLVCKDCLDPMEDCRCIQDTVDFEFDPPNDKLIEASKRYALNAHKVPVEYFGSADAADLYSKVETFIIRWNLDGTRTAGSLAREIIQLIK